MYAVLGFILGLAGMGLFLWGVQRWVSILAGLFMVLWALNTMLIPAGSRFPMIRECTPVFKKVFGDRLSRQSYSSLLIIGLLNGILPCGLVYIALAGATLSSSPYSGAIHMFVFGLGTIPVMAAISLGGTIIGQRFRATARKIVPWFVLLIGILFILRGLNLGIPYLSPKMETEKEVPACCHGK
jgi:sulfite exporter TauE/SafE